VEQALPLKGGRLYSSQRGHKAVDRQGKSHYEYNAEVLSAETSSLELFKAYAHHVLANPETVMSFYDSQRFKRLRWKTYMSRQKDYEKLISDLTAGDPNALIVWGDARFPSAGRGSPAVPTSGLRKNIGSRARALDHDEFRTSEPAACCHTELERVEDPQTGKSSWELRSCQNNVCPRMGKKCVSGNQLSVTVLGVCKRETAATGFKEK